ncbi:hypothetical protein [Rhizobium sp. SL86]|uniref:hypothetical protein n=1 Tax=Rhizobium sp. SL86 TaxID=2995148 RepID=UPI002272A990|nr:hypothetical protein [Rhizobium sp. SL86]MCY1665098.1 hypothetical protein [Rhizobium sp. SL86]
MREVRPPLTSRNAMNGTTRRLKFVVIGPAPFLKERTRMFWSQASIDLLGPVAATDLAVTPLDEDLDGAIIDVRYEADILLSVIDILQAQNIPALFASPMSLTAHLTGGFVLSRDADDMAAIVRQLLGDKNVTLH